jgi:hypothetical protein
MHSPSSQSNATLVRQNLRVVKRLYPTLRQQDRTSLRNLTRMLQLSISAGELRHLDGQWYVTHAGLLRVAARRHCQSIRTDLQVTLCDPAAGRWVFKAIVYKSSRSKGFVGYGDADPSNVSSLVHGAEMRVAETRAVNRALRKAYGIGLCSVEELGWSPRPAGAKQSNQNGPSANGNNGHENGHPRLRDRLCLLIRQHRLDGGLVKAYAADYCGTGSLRDASREQVEAFIKHLTERASHDREALLCHLNSYPKQEEATK